MFFRNQLKLVLIIRSDLKLSKGKTASQAAHAAVMCFKKTLETDSSLASQWLNVGQPKIVLKVDSLAELESLRDLAKSAGIVSSLILDAGRTQISPGTATCLGLGPDYTDKIDALVKELKLL
jgi:peptidyl-tRNA hydrolase, PTH2 family